MSVDTALSAIQGILAALNSSPFRYICAILHYESELDNLQRTVNTVKAVLLDAEAKGDEELSNQAHLFIEELMDAIYDADDLFDEFVTFADRNHKKLLQENEDSSSSQVSEKMHYLFSRIRNIPVAYKMSRGIETVKKKLDAIADNHNKFGFKLDSQLIKLDSEPIRKRRQDTCSYVYSRDIIGRHADRKKIVAMLLDPNIRTDVSFLAIWGMGGLGKTTLAQLIYNDERITKEFPTKLWVCVGEEDPNHLDAKTVVVKILELAIGHKPDISTMELLQQNVQEHLFENGRKKYLLILDDLWTENPIKWLKLEKYLKQGRSGSRVLVTTRSSITARMIGNEYSYELKGLSEKNSWKLFQQVAFGETDPGPELVKIGKKIVKKCANVPLAIRVVGTLLYGQGEDKWLSFERNEFAEVGPMKNHLFSILKLSYHQLVSSLKSCFTYCALFPKDYVIKKEMLLQLWLAQGFVVPLEKNQSLEDAAEEYFLILLRRGFFQDVAEDENGDIISFKLHDLMHDVAHEVSKKEVCIVDCIKNNFDEKIRHLSVLYFKGTKGAFAKSATRTLIHLNLIRYKTPSYLGTVIDSWKCLRALGLNHLDLHSLPNQIGKLVHLRYLDLSGNTEMKLLPKSLTKLYNLETLILMGCTYLNKLPNDLCKLVKLRCLNLEGCPGVAHMPEGMDKLSFLHKLTDFNVNMMMPDGENVLESLKGLNSLKGKLNITISCSEEATYEKGSSSEGGYLIKKQYLSWVNLVFVHFDTLEEMQPHPKLKRLQLQGYGGVKLPSWARGDNMAGSLPNLMHIEVCDCLNLKYLAPFGELRHLKSLKLSMLKNLEYMEEKRETEDTLFFPSLEILELKYLYRLKGWWREKEDDADSSRSIRRRREPQELPAFPLLRKYEILECPELVIAITVPDGHNQRTIQIFGRLKRVLTGWFVT